MSYFPKKIIFKIIGYILMIDISWAQFHIWINKKILHTNTRECLWKVWSNMLMLLALLFYSLNFAPELCAPHFSSIHVHSLKSADSSASVTTHIYRLADTGWQSRSSPTKQSSPMLACGVSTHYNHVAVCVFSYLDGSFSCGVTHECR